MTGASFLYFVLRYAPMMNRVSVLFSLAYTDRNSVNCITLSWMYEILSFFTLASVAILSALRVHAVWDNNRLLLILLLVLGLVLPCTHLVIRSFPAIGEPPSLLPTTRWGTCPLFLADPLQTTSMPKETARLLLMVSRIASLASDLLVVALVSAKTIQLCRQALVEQPSCSIVVMILRDGTIYFVILAASSISLMFALANTNYDGSFDMILTLSSILMGRFFVHLRKVASYKHRLRHASFSSTTRSQDDGNTPWESARFTVLRETSLLHYMDPRLGDGIIPTVGEEEEDIDRNPSIPTHKLSNQDIPPV